MNDIEQTNELRGQARDALQEALYEIKRVIVGQDAMLERLLVSLLAGGHVLLEGVPGLAKTLTVKTLAAVLGGSYNRIQFTPDLVPADLVGTRVYRPDTGAFETELGPVLCNFLLAGEMACAYFMAHVPQGFWPALNHGEAAVFYCFVFLYFSAAGGGPWSLDRLLRNR